MPKPLKNYFSKVLVLWVAEEWKKTDCVLNQADFYSSLGNDVCMQYCACNFEEHLLVTRQFVDFSKGEGSSHLNELFQN